MSTGRAPQLLSGVGRRQRRGFTWRQGDIVGLQDDGQHLVVPGPGAPVASGTVWLDESRLQQHLQAFSFSEKDVGMARPVSYQFADGVATITMDDGKVNALSLSMLAAVNEALDQALDDAAIVILAGRPGIFSGGFDLKVLGGGGADAGQLLDDGFLLALRLLEHPFPVVIACTGHAIAMGSFLLMSADYRIGIEGPYRLVANEVAIGLTMPQAAIEICRQRLTPADFQRAVMLAETYTPSGGVAAGFLDRVVGEADLMQEATLLAQHFATLDPHAHAATKALARTASVGAIRTGLEADRVIFRQLG